MEDAFIQHPQTVEDEVDAKQNGNVSLSEVLEYL